MDDCFLCNYWTRTAVLQEVSNTEFQSRAWVPPAWFQTPNPSSPQLHFTHNVINWAFLFENKGFAHCLSTLIPSVIMSRTCLTHKEQQCEYVKHPNREYIISIWEGQLQIIMCDIFHKVPDMASLLLCNTNQIKTLIRSPNIYLTPYIEG